MLISLLPYIKEFVNNCVADWCRKQIYLNWPAFRVNEKFNDQIAWVSLFEQWRQCWSQEQESVFSGRGKGAEKERPKKKGGKQDHLIGELHRLFSHRPVPLVCSTDLAKFDSQIWFDPLRHMKRFQTDLPPILFGFLRLAWLNLCGKTTKLFADYLWAFHSIWNKFFFFSHVSSRSLRVAFSLAGISLTIHHRAQKNSNSTHEIQRKTKTKDINGSSFEKMLLLFPSISMHFRSALHSNCMWHAVHT